jgi:predicted ATPase
LSEKLIIRNFGPIKGVELDLKKFNVIIGEQATGKSTIAKVLAVCRYFSFIVKTSFNSNNIHLDVLGDGAHFYEGLVSWGLLESCKNGSEIFYENENYSIDVKIEINISLPEFDSNGNQRVYKHVGTKINLKPLSEKFKGLLFELDKLKPNDKNELTNWNAPTSFFQNDVSKVMKNPFYIPTERGLQSLFSLGKNSIQNISDSLFNQFANLDLIARNFSEETSIEPLNITYKNVDGRGYIRQNKEDDFFSLYNGASGYKSTIPIVLVNKYYNEVRNKNKILLIEEPELNLFPIAQMHLINYLASDCVNTGNQILITTHSPYILMTMSNLMFAHNTGNMENKIHFEEIDKITPSKYWINPKEISAYMLHTDGTCENIIGKEGLIKTGKIDEVSKILNTEFNKVFDIELDIVK